MTSASMDASTTFSAEGNGSEAMAQRAKQAAEDAFNELKDRAGDYVDAGREKALALTGVIEQQIRERPVPSLAVAAGIGFALGLFYSRRS